MRVGLISFHSFLKPGGVKNHILGLHKELKKRGVYSKIIVPRRKKLENYGKDVILLGTSFPLTFSGSQADFDINFNPLAIEKVLRREKFNILHFHNFGFPSSFQILLSPSTLNTLNILTCHFNIKGSKFLKRFPIFIYFLNKICQWRIDGVIGVSPLTLKVFKKYNKPKIIIPNGINLKEFNPEVPKIKKFEDGKINILFLGRIEERKGLIYLLKAYKILEKTPLFKKGGVGLVIVGEGPLKSDCQNWAKDNKLKNVIFEESVPVDKIPSYYRSCDIFVSPAIFGESFGLVLIEAMASGIPVVAFANEGYKNVLTGKGAKFLAKPRDYKMLAEKLEILIKDAKLRKEMGEWGIKESKKYSWPKIAGQVLDFYQVCLKKKREKKMENNPSKQFDKIISKVYDKKVLSWLKWPK